MLPILPRFFLFALLTSGLLPVNYLRTVVYQTDGPPAGSEVQIDTPAGGEAIQGSVQVTGSADAETFAGYELSFAYTEDPRETWFLISEKTEPVLRGSLAEWDTFSITDGDYDLRLVVFLADGSTLVYEVTGVRVRNYSLVETATPTPPATAVATATTDINAVPTSMPGVTDTPLSTATPLPPNPAEIRPGAIPLSLARGAAGVLALFVVLGMYTSIRSMRRK